MEGTHWDCGSGWLRVAPWVCEPRARGGQAAAPASRNVETLHPATPTGSWRQAETSEQRNFRERWTHSLEVSCIKCKALIGKEWASATWAGPPEGMFVGALTLRPCTPEPAGGPLSRPLEESDASTPTPADDAELQPQQARHSTRPLKPCPPPPSSRAPLATAQARSLLVRKVLLNEPAGRAWEGPGGGAMWLDKGESALPRLGSNSLARAPDVCGS